MVVGSLTSHSVRMALRTALVDPAVEEKRGSGWEYEGGFRVANMRRDVVEAVGPS